jgi:hypothetical protein
MFPPILLDHKNMISLWVEFGILRVVPREGAIYTTNYFTISKKSIKKI